MTAEDLAHWCHALFEGKVLNRQSMIEMLNFNLGKGFYGLGVGLFDKETGSGEKVIGHSGANIGTSAYMLHFTRSSFFSSCYGK